MNLSQKSFDILNYDKFITQAIVSSLAVSWPSKLYKPELQAEVAMLFKELLYENFLQKGM